MNTVSRCQDKARYHTFSEDHCPSQVLDRLLNDIIQDPHHGNRLLLAETFSLEALDELQGVEVMVARASWGRMESATSRVKGRDIYPIMSDGGCILGCRLGWRGLAGNESTGNKCPGGGVCEARRLEGRAR